MSNFGPGPRNRAASVPTPPTGRRIATYGTYLAAQRAVDFLSDREFPVQHVTIVGTNLQMVERVTGRLTYGRVAAAGAATGAWFGLFVGLLLSLFAPGNSMIGTVLPALVIGAGFGILFGVLSYAFTGGRRDFTSTSQVVASQYALLCAADHATAAEQLLAELPDDRAARVAPTTEVTTADTVEGRRDQTVPSQAPLAPSEQAPAEQQPTGPTYSEMIEKQRRERLEREREREREQLDRERQERQRQENERGQAPDERG